MKGLVAVIVAAMCIGVGFSLASATSYFQRRSTNNERICKLDAAITNILITSLAKVPAKWTFNHPAAYEEARTRTHRYVDSIVAVAPCDINTVFPKDPLDYPGGP